MGSRDKGPDDHADSGAERFQDTVNYLQGNVSSSRVRTMPMRHRVPSWALSLASVAILLSATSFFLHGFGGRPEALESRLATAEQRLAGVEALESRLATAEQRLAGVESLESRLATAEQRLAGVEALESRLATAEQRLGSLERLNEQISRVRQSILRCTQPQESNYENGSGHALSQNSTSSQDRNSFNSEDAEYIRSFVTCIREAVSDVSQSP